eukprot:3272716-Rhodomonas_salina.1
MRGQDCSIKTKKQGCARSTTYSSGHVTSHVVGGVAAYFTKACFSPSCYFVTEGEKLPFRSYHLFFRKNQPLSTWRGLGSSVPGVPPVPGYQGTSRYPNP